MKLNKRVKTASYYLAATIASLTIAATNSAYAASDIKIGMILPMTGPFASYGQQILNGVHLYMSEHGDTVQGRQIKLIVKDDTGVAPEISKRAAQELIVKDKADILAGFGVTPSAFAVAPISAQAKMPMIVMNAATSSVTEKSPYIVRTSMSMPQTSAPMAIWAAKQGITKVYTLVADYGPGHDAEKQFVKTFTAAGGEVVGEARVPLKNPDFSPFLQRIKDSKPNAVFLFVPAGEQSVSFLKGFAERGLHEAGIKLMSTGDLTDEDVLDAMGETAVGAITSFHYSEAHDSSTNKAYTKGFYKAYPNKRPNFLSVAGYDGMHLIYNALNKTAGDPSGDKFIEVVKGMSWESPRGPISIDPETRDIVQNIYIRKVEKADGKLQNVEFDHVANFKDPSK